MPLPFPGLSDADFDAYLPARATSNTFVRPRLEVKQKVLAVGRELAERAQRSGVALEVHASDERPSVWNKKSVTEQWVFLWRDRAARAELERAHGDRKLGESLLDPTPFYRHAFLALYLDAERFEVTLRLHRDAWADVKNLQRRLETDGGRSALASALGALPADFTIGVAAGEHAIAREADAARVAALLDAAVSNGSWLFVARTVSRADAVARGASLREAIDEAFEALLPVYAVLAWRRDDDLAAIVDDLARERDAHAVQMAQVAAREAEWRSRHDAEIARRREEAGAEARERAAALEPARPAAVHAATAGLTALESRPRETPARPATGIETRSAERAPVRPRERDAKPERRNEAAPRRQDTADADRAPRREVPAPRAGVEKPPVERAAPRGPVSWVERPGPVLIGGRVRIRTGPFAGKEGTVTALDAKGQARVSLGLLTARVELTDLITLAEST